LAVEVLYNGFLTVNGVDLSNRMKSLDVVLNQETRDPGPLMGDTNRKVIPGLTTPSITATFAMDRAAGNVLATLRPLVGIAVVPFTVVAKYKNAATSTTNEQYTMTSVISGDLALIRGSAGEVEEVSVTFANTSGAGIVVATS
jgi:hypothetical protein